MPSSAFSIGITTKGTASSTKQARHFGNRTFHKARFTDFVAGHGPIFTSILTMSFDQQVVIAVRCDRDLKSRGAATAGIFIFRSFIGIVNGVGRCHHARQRGFAAGGCARHGALVLVATGGLGVLDNARLDIVAVAGGTAEGVDFTTTFGRLVLGRQVASKGWNTVVCRSSSDEKGNSQKGKGLHGDDLVVAIRR